MMPSSVKDMHKGSPHKSSKRWELEPKTESWKTLDGCGPPTTPLNQANFGYEYVFQL
jgi:hypothetical protein